MASCIAAAIFGANKGGRLVLSTFTIFFGANPCVKYHCAIFCVEIKEVAAWWWERRVVKKQPCLYDFVSLPVLHPRKTCEALNKLFLF